MIHMFSLAAIGGYELEELKNVFIMQGFSGLTLFSIFLLMALGLAIIFGQMKVINMAHGEFLTLGAYTTVLCSDFVTKFAPGFLPYYLEFAMFPAFLATALVEFLLIRHLYSCPLDTLLATFGVSLIMQQGFRLFFGGREDKLDAPGELLSRGQQQQLAIARALVAEPRVLILDEPTEGIQPSIIKDLARQINDLKLSKDLAIVVSEQVLSFTIDIADKMYVIESGRFVREDTRGNFDVEKITSYLSV